MIAAGSVALSAPGASVQGDDGGLQVAPDSPSGTGYAIPLDGARRKGSSGPRENKIPPGVSESPAFGQAVSDDRPPTGTSTGSDRSGGAGDYGSGKEHTGSGGPSRNDRGGGSGRPETGRSEGGAGRLQFTRSRGETGSGQVLAAAGVGGGVVLLGAHAGVTLRRRR